MELRLESEVRAMEIVADLKINVKKMMGTVMEMMIVLEILNVVLIIVTHHWDLLDQLTVALILKKVSRCLLLFF